MAPPRDVTRVDGEKRAGVQKTPPLQGSDTVKFVREAPATPPSLPPQDEEEGVLTVQVRPCSMPV